MNGTIYFLSAVGCSLIKLGWTGRPFEARLGQIRSINAPQIEVIGTIPGSLDQELDMHKEIAEYRDHDEWYHDGHELRDWIREHIIGSHSEQA